jgi:hypothetical protein
MGTRTEPAPLNRFGADRARAPKSAIALKTLPHTGNGQEKVDLSGIVRPVADEARAAVMISKTCKA